MSCKQSGQNEEEAEIEHIDFLKELNQEIKANPTNDSLLLYRAKLLLESSYAKLAKYSCEEAWAIKPSVAAAVCKCQALEATGKYAESIEWLEEIRGKISKSNSLLFLLAEAYQKTNNLQKIITTLQEVDTANLMPNLAFEMATVASDIDKYDVALRFINLGLKHSSSIDFLLMKAYVLTKLRHPSTLAFLQTLKTHKDFKKNKADIFYLFGNYYYENHQLNEAYSYYEKATQEDFRFQSAYISKAQILKQQKKYQLALDQLYIASEVGHPTATLLEESGDCFLAKRDTAEAISYYESSYRLDSTRTHLLSTIQSLTSKK